MFITRSAVFVQAVIGAQLRALSGDPILRLRRARAPVRRRPTA